MKKLIFGCVLLGAIFVGSCVNAFANTITIDSAKQNEAGDIQVECKVTGTGQTKKIAVLSCEYKDETYVNSLMYINQITPVMTDGSFAFEFKPASWTDGENKVYIVRVGGESVDVPGSMIIAFYDGKTYTACDVNGDGNIDKGDAALVLKYIGDVVSLKGQQIVAADVDGNNIVDITDAIAILKQSEVN